MRTREEVRERVKQIIQNAPQNPYNILDQLANLLKGTNICVASYIKRGNKLLISANTDYVDQGETDTKYDDECMLDYTRGFKPPTGGGYQDLNVTLAADKRLKDTKYLKKLKNKLDELCQKLSEIISTQQYIDHDDFAEEAGTQVQNPLGGLVDGMKMTVQNFTQQIQNLQPINPQALIQIFIGFRNNIIQALTKFVQLNYIDQSKLQEINQIFEKIINEDLRFIGTITELIGLPGDHPIKLALTQDFDLVEEIDVSRLPASIIPLVSPPKTKINGSYHTEHRIIVELDENNRNQEQEYDYIGISMHCCAMCYHIITNLGNGVQVAGTHKECYGDSLVGIRLHSQEEQQTLIYSLLPELDPNQNNQQQDVTMLDNQTQVNFLGNQVGTLLDIPTG